MNESINKFSCLLIVLVFTGLPVVASDEALPGQQNSANLEAKIDVPTAGTNSNVTSSAPLKGGVQKVELDLQKLQDVGLDLKEALRAASSLYDEVSIQPVRIITQPSLVGGGTIINLPIGTEPVGPPAPARKERVDLAINRIKPIINLLKNNVDDFVDSKKQLDLPDDVLTTLEPSFKTWIDLVNTLTSKQARLDQITLAPPYDNRAIASLTASMQEDLKNLDKNRLAIYKVIRKEGKRKQRGSKK